MLNPFSIRDLHVSPSSSHEECFGSSSSPGVIQISAADYDDIASNHPRARLTYTDDDDGDQVTVGSSFELSQRLDEPIPLPHRLEPAQPSQYGAKKMHVFDIRRSNSVTELWKRFEYSPDDDPKISEPKNDALSLRYFAVDDAGPGEAVAPDNAASATNTPREQSQSFLAAFEAELAYMLSSTEISENRTSQPEPSPAARPSINSGSQRVPPAVDALVTQVVHYLRSGVNVMQSELRTRMPELRRQIREAQRDLPENLTASLQAFVAQLEAQMRTAYSNFPEHGRQLTEEAIQAGRPMAENAAESLRALASDFEQAGRTLFAAFENEFGRTGLNATGATTGRPSNAPTLVPEVTNINQPSLSSRSQATESRPVKKSPQGDIFTVPNPSTVVSKRRAPEDCAETDPYLSGSGCVPQTLFIGNVGFNVTERIIFDVFLSEGFIVDVHLPLDAASGRHAGFGYLQFASASVANLAIYEMQGVHIDGHAINLEISDCTPVELTRPWWQRRIELANSGRTYIAQPSSCPADADRGNREQSTSDENVARQHPGSPIKRRKPSTLHEPSSSLSRHESSSPIDLSTDAPASTAETRDRTDDRWMNLNPELEMSRFPPVSQLEAQHVAKQWQARASGSLPTTAASRAADNNDPSRGTPSTCQVSPDPFQTVYCRQPRDLIDVQDTVCRGQDLLSPEMMNFDGKDHERMPFCAPPGMAPLMGQGRHTRSLASSGDPQNAAGGRLRAAERHSPHLSTRHSTVADTWARLDRRERRRSRQEPSQSQDTSGSSPVGGASQPNQTSLLETVEQAKKAEIENCISSLLNMGFGAPEQGGRSRLAVYAAAANGSISDAIGLIEEEQKAYAEQGQE